MATSRVPAKRAVRTSTRAKPKTRVRKKAAPAPRRRPTPPVPVASVAAPPAPATSLAARMRTNTSPTSPSRKTRATVAAWSSVAVLGLLLGAVALGMPAIASEGNSGTIKVHDEATASPDQRNEAHVDCEDFWVEGFNMADGAGYLVFLTWPPTGDKTEVLRANWTADAHDHEDGGFHFLAGPFALEPGHYRVEAYNEGGHPGNEDHFAKAKMFWVEPCDTSQELSCPTDLVAVSHEEGGFLISWTPAEGSDGTNVYRAVGDEEFELIAFVEGDGSSYHDTEVQPGVTYTYTVTGLFGDRESTNCAEASISMIPDFPTMFAMTGAAMAAVGGYVLATRRRN